MSILCRGQTRALLHAARLEAGTGKRLAIRSVQVRRATTGVVAVIRCVVMHRSSDYFWALLHASATFARELAGLPYQVATVGDRKDILLRAMWLLDGGRWRYIKSVCSVPRPAVAKWKPRSAAFEQAAN
jgi:uncharacterized membrane protein